ncbi:hypothetical protein LCGC14_2037820 [marine sediment metagenome]|uniref:Uncharacterized protein n=1 Tax=marine sediment metagenome TaxID=412755 RepID=A0A0F9H677_9ZZZZ
MHRLKFKEINKEEFEIWNKKEELMGFLEYDEKWEQFVYLDPERKIKLAVDCLQQLLNFLKEL